MYGYVHSFFGGGKGRGALWWDILFKWLHDLDLFLFDGWGWWWLEGVLLYVLYVSVDARTWGVGPPPHRYVFLARFDRKKRKKK